MNLIIQCYHKQLQSLSSSMEQLTQDLFVHENCNMCMYLFFYFPNKAFRHLVYMHVDYSKITEDKSSESRVQTPDARLIIATGTAPRREGRNSRLNITAMTKTRESKPASQHHCSNITTVPRCKGRNPRLCFTAMVKTQSFKLASQSSVQYQDAEPEAHVSHKT